MTAVAEYRTPTVIALDVSSGSSAANQPPKLSGRFQVCSGGPETLFFEKNIPLEYKRDLRISCFQLEQQQFLRFLC